MSSDPALHTDLYPCRRDEAHHSAGPEPPAAAVWPEELRVHLPHPGQHVQRAGAQVQQQQHSVSEDHGKMPNALEALHEIITTRKRGNTVRRLVF